MKMKMKMALMAGALALSMVGQASAAIVSGATGSSSLVLSIWDTTSLTSYTTTLGDLSFSSFAAGVTGTSTTLTASGAAVGNQTFAADALLTSYLSGVNMATTVWNVQAIDSVGSGFKGQAVVTTTNANIKSAANSLATTQQNTQVVNAAGVINNYYTSVGATTPATFTSGNAAAYAGTGLTTNAKTSLAFNSTATIGSAMNFWYVTPSSTMSTARASVAQFQGVGQAATWSLASNGDLTYTVGAVPEPGEWLLMLSGLCLIGFIATRRKNEGSMTFA